MFHPFLRRFLVCVHPLQRAAELRPAELQDEHLLAMRPDDRHARGAAAGLFEVQLRRLFQSLANHRGPLQIGSVIAGRLNAILFKLRSHVRRGHKLVRRCTAAPAQRIRRQEIQVGPDASATNLRRWCRRWRYRGSRVEIRRRIRRLLACNRLGRRLFEATRRCLRWNGSQDEPGEHE